MIDAYQQFLQRKTQLENRAGFKPLFMPDFLFDFQKALVEKAVVMGRYALFEDCGLGKTAQELVWAQNVVQKTNRPVLILCPLAVAAQTIREAAKFGIEASRCNDGKIVAGMKIVVTNYEKLHLFNADDFAGVVCDESSILKSFDGALRLAITIFMRKVQYRLLGTATAAPNDYTELGTSSEALGMLGHMDMLGKYFKNDSNTCKSRGGISTRGFQAEKWRFKGHAEQAFWQWVCSWSRAIRKPSDLGFDDGKFILPPLIERQHIVKTNTLADGYLFALPAAGLKEQRAERRRSIDERCEMVAKLAGQSERSMIWCHLNPEGDLLEKMIDNCVQISGADSDEAKEDKFTAFASGQATRMISKAKILGFGINAQFCSHVIPFPSHSYEQYYQLVRRCWRFGQENPVTVDIVASEGELNVLRNMQRKAVAASKMFDRLIAEMNHASGIKNGEKFTTKEEYPKWLKSN